MTDPASAPTASQAEWLTVRRHLQSHRHELVTPAAKRYPGSATIAGTPLLGPARWTPERPVGLDDLRLFWSPAVEVPAVAADGSLPWRPDGSRYRSYSEVLGELAAPSVFEDRPTYRLVSADLAGESPSLGFAIGSYFDGIDTGEAAAHELAARELGVSAGTPLRDALGDPWDLTRRPANVAISCLTVRMDARTGSLKTPLHWRDPAKVGHAGGLYQVMPSGVFQATSDRPADRENDFSLWHCLIRECAEELLGAEEVGSSEGRPVDYAAWPLAADLTAARREGAIRVHCVGLGVDPLTFATDLLVTMVVDAGVYDQIFGGAVRTNDEGRTLGSAEGAGADGLVVLDDEAVRAFSGEKPMQAAGAAALRLAWRHRDTLFG